jgi:hypothetical protein
MRLRSLPKVFHTCGKNCGKSRGFDAAPLSTVVNPDTKSVKIGDFETGDPGYRIGGSKQK